MVPLASTESVMAASTASTRFCGPLTVIVEGSATMLADLIARGEAAKHPRMHRDLPGKPRVKREVELAGDNLHDLQFLRLMDLLRGQIEGAFSRLHAAEFDFSVDIRGLQPAHDALRTAHPDLGPWNIFRTDLQVLRNVMEFDGHIDRNFRHRIARHRQPQSHGQRQRKQLQSEIVQHVPAKKIFHG